jgi:hypothetical protein
VEFNISVVPLYEFLGVLFISFVENQLHPISEVTILLSNVVVNFSVSGKGEKVTEAVCDDSSVASSSTAENGEASATVAIVDVSPR